MGTGCLMTNRRNELRLGDNLPLLRDRSLFPDESIDLIYLDPPQNPHRGTHTAAREIETAHYDHAIPVPENIWRWDSHAESVCHEVARTAPEKLRAAMAALEITLGHSAMFAYLVHMAPRLIELHRVLKKTGSLFLHCDPIASHYLKMLLDTLFGQRALVNEIVWKRVSSHGDVVQATNHMGRIHDIILFYRKSDRGTFHIQYTVGSDEYLDHYYPYTDYQTGKRYRLGDVTTTKQTDHGVYEWRIKREGEQGKWMADLDNEWRAPSPGWEYKLVPPYKGRHWALPRPLMEQAEREGLLVYSRIGYPHIKRFHTGGVPVQDLWVDIAPVTGSDRLFPTQKPKALLERIIAMASNPGDVILDPFCGAGASIDAVESINRQNPEAPPRVWIGIEASSLAMNLTRYRLARFRNPTARYKLIGDIREMRRAELFAARCPVEFQYWAFGLVGARPWGNDKVRRSADRAVDGVRFFSDKKGPKPLPIIIQAKATNVKLDDVRGLLGFCDRIKAPMGILISMQEPTRDALTEAGNCGEYHCEGLGQTYPRIQIATVEQLLQEQGTTGGVRSLRLPPRYIGEVFK